ncbi:MAG TPA: NAD-dependent epimerase/dehydratase family protein, partial [Cyclobacteriaceae bacterium]|nr:NAD-dependent epimerase/dehydratase family protein [Cyclobacteriaceae bacterium]
MIAITGANGLLGSFVLKKFVAEKQTVVALKRSTSNLSALAGFTDNVIWREADITNSLALRDAFESVDTVIHTAALVSFDPRSKNKIFDTNVVGTRNIVNACLAQGIRRLIFISSVAALGRKKGVQEVSEEARWVDSDLNSDYAKSKYLAELEVYRGQEEGLSVSIVNPSVILSTADPHKSSAQLFKYVQQQRPFYTGGSINYVDVRDVADSVYYLYQNPAPGEKFIISAGTTDLSGLLSKIASRLGK